MPPRPVLRGVSHLVAAIVAPAGLVALLLIAASPRAYVGASIFGAGVILLFGTSAAYHLLPWHTTPSSRGRASAGTNECGGARRVCARPARVPLWPALRRR